MVLPPGTDRAVTTAVPRLALETITRHYGPVIALDEASLTLRAGEVHALLGENGAGKSTLMKIAFGLEQPDGGTIRIDGTSVTLRSPRSAMQHGIGMVQQHFALVDAMTVAENVALGSTARLDLLEVATQVRAISAASGLIIDPDALVRDLPVGAQQRVEIIKALSRDTSILILDEPTAVLAPQEVAELLAWTRRFADGGGTVVLIAHKLHEVLRVADHVTVLRRGRVALTAPAAEVTARSLADAMLGGGQHTPGTKARSDITPSLPGNATQARPVLELRDVTVRDAAGVERLRAASITIAAGEIVGIAAVEGAGQHELLRVMSGRLHPSSGDVHLPQAIGFVPEDRHREAVVLDATLIENVALRGAGTRRGLMAWTSLRTDTEALMATRDVRAETASVTMRTLSGGNQQKLVLGRELASSPQALVVENPTRGLDILATEEVHTALRAARDAGTAVVVYSSDLDEVLALADRVLVVSGGQLRAVGHDREVVGRAMLAGGT
jgi:ABC-type uncharacterized transport system ATPase subunit